MHIYIIGHLAQESKSINSLVVIVSSDRLDCRGGYHASVHTRFHTWGGGLLVKMSSFFPDLLVHFKKLLFQGIVVIVLQKIEVLISLLILLIITMVLGICKESFLCLPVPLFFVLAFHSLMVGVLIGALELFEGFLSMLELLLVKLIYTDLFNTQGRPVVPWLSV